MGREYVKFRHEWVRKDGTTVDLDIVAEVDCYLEQYGDSGNGGRGMPQRCVDFKEIVSIKEAETEAVVETSAVPEDVLEVIGIKAEKAEFIGEDDDRVKGED